MSYIKKIKIDKDKKKVVSVRVSEIVVNAFNSAGVEAKEIGYEFKLPDVIEEALLSTLRELRDETGVDFLKLERFKYEMNSLQDKLQIDSRKRFDFNKLSNEIKTQAFNIGNTGESVDIDLIIKEKEKEIKSLWSTHMISKKEEKVRTELEELTENVASLKGQLNALHDDDYYNNGGHDRDMAHNEGWGHSYDKIRHAADNAYKETFDALMKKNKKEIQEQIDSENKATQARQKVFLCEKYPKKTDAEIKDILDAPFDINSL